MYSIISSDEYGDLSIFASFNLTQNIRAQILNNKLKNNYGVQSSPLIKSEIINIIPGPFHECCRLILTTLKWTLMLAVVLVSENELLKTLIETLQDEGIKLAGEDSNYFQVSGNSGKKCVMILKKIFNFLNFFPEDKRIPLQLVWRECGWLCSFIMTTIPSEEDRKDYYYHALCYSTLMVEIFCKEAITVTIRTILDHNPYWIEKMGSIGVFVEESIEANHVLQNFLFKNCTMKNGGKEGAYGTNKSILLIDNLQKMTEEELNPKKPPKNEEEQKRNSKRGRTIYSC
jgi:hypothetical protein